MNHDLVAIDRNVFPFLQILKNATHHFARGTDTVGNALLRQSFVDNPCAIDWRRALHEEANHASVDIFERQALDVGVRSTQQSDQP